MEALEGFWEDADNASKIQKEKSLLQEVVSTYSDLKDLHDEFEILLEYVENEDDEESGNELLNVFDKFLKSFSTAEQKVLLSGEADPNNAIVSINAGAGGTESCDWANMLYRMIIRWG